MTSVLAVVLVLGGLIFFHELGHFLVARFLGIGVKTFSLGFGPRLAGVKRGRTEYRLSAIPLGGYVSLVAERPEEEDEADAEFPEHMRFSSRPPWQRMLVVAAGPVFNFLLAWLLLWMLAVSQGRTEMLPKVGDLTPQGPAAVAGVRVGDEITAIDGHPVASWTRLSETIKDSRGRTLELTLERGGKSIAVKVTPTIQSRKNIFGETVPSPMIGITASGETRTYPVGPVEAIGESAAQTWRLVSLTVQGVVKIIERIIPLDTLGGPIMIAQLVSRQAEQGLADVLALAALISVNLGLINLLPIPVLDGGHLLYFALEIVMRRPLSDRVRAMATRFGILFILALMGLALYNDIVRLLTKAPL